MSPHTTENWHMAKHSFDINDIDNTLQQMVLDFIPCFWIRNLAQVFLKDAIHLK